MSRQMQTLTVKKSCHSWLTEFLSSVGSLLAAGGTWLCSSAQVKHLIAYPMTENLNYPSEWWRSATKGSWWIIPPTDEDEAEENFLKNLPKTKIPPSSTVHMAVDIIYSIFCEYDIGFIHQGLADEHT